MDLLRFLDPVSYSRMDFDSIRRLIRFYAYRSVVNYI